MKYILTLLLIIFFFNKSYALEKSILSEVLYDKFQFLNNYCQEEGHGNLKSYPGITFTDISNDYIKDLIIDWSGALCEESYSAFAGGTGGSHYTILINVSEDQIKKISGMYEENITEGIFNFWTQGINITSYPKPPYGTVLELFSHRIGCEDIGGPNTGSCKSILYFNGKNLEILETRIPIPFLKGE